MSKGDLLMFTGLIVAFVLCYLYYGLESALNGGTVDRHLFWMPFRCFWEEVLWNIPGGFKRKVEYVRKNFVGDWNGSVCGSTRSWNYEEVRTKNLFVACTRDVMRGTINFWLTMTIVSGIGFWFGYYIQTKLF